MAFRHRLLRLVKDWERQIRGREQRSPQNLLNRVGEDILLHVPGYTAPPVKKYSSVVTRYKTPAKTNTMTAMLDKKERQQ